MATFYGVEATKRLNQAISQLASQGTAGGRVKMVYDEYTLTATKAQNDLIKGPLLPAGARVVNAFLAWDASLDASGGTLHLGWEANLVDAADDDGFLASVDVTGAGGCQDMAGDQGSRPGLFKLFSAVGGPTQINAKCAHSGGLDSTSGTVKMAIFFVLD